jgi:hypothetical protein
MGSPCTHCRKPGVAWSAERRVELLQRRQVRLVQRASPRGDELRGRLRARRRGDRGRDRRSGGRAAPLGRRCGRRPFRHVGSLAPRTLLRACPATANGLRQSGESREGSRCEPNQDRPTSRIGVPVNSRCHRPQLGSLRSGNDPLKDPLAHPRVSVQGHGYERAQECHPCPETNPPPGHRSRETEVSPMSLDRTPVDTAPEHQFCVDISPFFK